MPGFIARKLCPELVIVPANPKKYSVVSKQVKAIIAEYDPNFCPMSLDEAYLDLTEHLENRQTSPPAERTFLCRNDSNADSRAFCKCDMNETARKYGNVDVSVNSSSVSSKEVQVSSNTDSGINFNINAGEEGASVVCPDCGKELPPFTRVTFGVGDEDAVQELRTRIEQKTNLTASAGKSYSPRVYGIYMYHCVGTCRRRVSGRLVNNLKCWTVNPRFAGSIPPSAPTCLMYRSYAQGM